MTSLTSRPDFADWLSPMLVKELRQGMRSRIFMAAFFLTQALMILSTIFNLTATDGGGEFNQMGMFLNGLFWFMIAVPIVLLTPIRGFGSLHGEIKERTLELVFLTRLSAWRIAAGKWMALMVQALLLVCGVLPYVLLRYFVGGVNIIADLQSLLILLVSSGVLTAMTVAISPYESKLLRGLFVILLFIGFFLLLTTFFSMMAFGAITGAGTSSILFFFYLIMALFVPAVIVLSLEIGASRIAPSAENHAIRKRLIGVYFLLAGACLIAFKADANAVINCVLTLLTIVVIDAMGESQEFSRIVYRPFLQRGAMGRILSLFLTPGWVSASWFVALLAVICGAGLAWQGEFNDAGQILLRLSFLGALVVPAALIRLVLPRTPHFLGIYIAMQFFFGAITFVVSAISSMADQLAMIWLCPIPSCVFLLCLTEQIKPTQITSFMVVTGLVTVAALGILLARTITPLRDIRAFLRQDASADA